MRVEVAATPDQLTEIRGRLGSWLREVGTSEDLAGDVVLVVNEACTNSVEHAYCDTEPGVMRVEADLVGPGIRIRITDFGSWKLPGVDPRRGRGVPLMRAISDEVTVAGTATGTTVTMTFPLDGTVVEE